MRNTRNVGMLVLAVLMGFAIFSVFFNSEAQRRESVRIFTPGYYYVDEDSTSQNAQTSLITLTVSDFTRLNNYPTGLQVVFKTEEDNSETAAVTLKIGSLPAKRLLTRHGAEFNLLELDSGVILTATYDGTDFISDYTAARSLKGRLVATLDIADGTYGDNADSFGLEFIGGWTVESGITQLGTDNLAAGIWRGHPTQVDDVFLTLPTARFTDSQLGWFVEVLNGTTVVNTVFVNFGDYAAFGSRINTDNANIAFFLNTYGGGVVSSVSAPSFSISSAMQMTIPNTDDYSINVYLSEN